MATTIINGLFDYFGKCPLMHNGRLNIDYLPEDTGEAGIEYAIATSPTEEIVKRYLDGGAQCRYAFVISSVNDYGPDAYTNMENSGFFEALSQWLREQTRVRDFPEMPEGCTPRRIRAQNVGYLFNPDNDTGKYQIQCELEFFRKGER